MEKTDNIYMDALRFGVKNIPTGGTSINEMTEHLTNLGWNVRTTFGDYYQYWFYTNFYHKDFYNALKNLDPAHVHIRMKDANHFAPTKFPMTAEAFEVYQDFEKLKQAKIDTKEARDLSYKSVQYAKYAMWISIGVGVTQCILTIIQMATENDKFCLWCAF